MSKEPYETVNDIVTRCWREGIPADSITAASTSAGIQYMKEKQGTYPYPDQYVGREKAYERARKQWFDELYDAKILAARKEYARLKSK